MFWNRPGNRRGAASARRPSLLGLEQLGFGVTASTRTSRPPLQAEVLEVRVTPTYYPTSTTLVSAPNPSQPSQLVTLTTSTLALDPDFGDQFAPPSGGTVVFYNDAKTGTAELGRASTDFDGHCSITVTTLPAGANSLRASFIGGTLFNGFDFDTYGMSEGLLTHVVQTANTPPTISDISHQTIAAGSSVGPITFTVGDAETPVDTLTVTAVASDSKLVPTVTVGGSGANRTVTIASAAGQAGTANVTVTVSDGTASASDSFDVVLTTPQAKLTQPPLPPLPAGGTGVRLTAVGADAGGPSVVRVYNADGTQRFEVTPYESSFTGGVRVAVGDVTGDGVPDVVTAPGAGIATRVRAFNGVNGTPIWEFVAFEASFTGGAFVSVGDVDRDGRADAIVSPDFSGGPRVRIVSGRDGATTLNDFFGIDDPNFRGGARTAMGDFNGDGAADLAVLAGIGGGPRAAIFNGQQITTAGVPSRLLGDFFVFEQTLRNGVYAGAGDLNHDGYDDLVVGGGPGGGPRVMALNGADLGAGTPGATLANFFAGDSSLRGGVRVGVGDANADGWGEILTGVGPGGPPSLQVFGPDGSPVQSVTAFDAGFHGGVFVSGNQGTGATVGRTGGTNPLGQTTIRGRFLPNTPTAVIFSDQHGYRVEVPATSVTGSEVRAGVPVYLDPATGRPASSDGLTMAVVQRPEGGAEIFSGTVTQPVDGLPTSNLEPGTYTRLMLESTRDQLEDAMYNLYTVDWLTDDEADLEPVDDQITPVLDELDRLIEQIDQLQEGEIADSDFGFGPDGGESTLSDLAILDGILASGTGGDLSTLDAVLESIRDFEVELGQGIRNESLPFGNLANALSPFMVGPLGGAGNYTTAVLGYSSLMFLTLGGIIETASTGIIDGSVTPDQMNAIWAPPLANHTLGGAATTFTAYLTRDTTPRREIVANLMNTLTQRVIRNATQPETLAERLQRDSQNQSDARRRLFKTWTATRNYSSYSLTFTLTVSPEGANLRIQGPPNRDTPVGSGSAPQPSISENGVSGYARGTWTRFESVGHTTYTDTSNVYFSGTLNSRGELEASIAGNVMTMH